MSAPEKRLLDKEMETYQERVSGWDDKIGEFVLIKGEEVVGFYSRYADAVSAGYENFGLESFLVKQISVLEQSHFLPPLMTPSDGAFHSGN